jgi:hypothetical protein
MTVLLVILACAAWLAIGTFLLGPQWCARRSHCIRHQRAEVKRWTKEITGEITPEMQERLRKREQAAIKDTGNHPAIPERPRADKDNEGNR